MRGHPPGWSTQVKCSVCKLPVSETFTVVQQSTEGYGLYVSFGCEHAPPSVNDEAILGIAGSANCLAQILHNIIHQLHMNAKETQ